MSPGAQKTLEMFTARQENFKTTADLGFFLKKMADSRCRITTAIVCFVTHFGKHAFLLSFIAQSRVISVKSFWWEKAPKNELQANFSSKNKNYLKTNYFGLQNETVNRNLLWIQMSEVQLLWQPTNALRRNVIWTERSCQIKNTFPTCTKCLKSHSSCTLIIFNCHGSEQWQILWHEPDGSHSRMNFSCTRLVLRPPLCPKRKFHAELLCWVVAGDKNELNVVLKSTSCFQLVSHGLQLTFDNRKIFPRKLSSCAFYHSHTHSKWSFDFRNASFFIFHKHLHTIAFLHLFHAFFA